MITNNKFSYSTLKNINNKLMYKDKLNELISEFIELNKYLKQICTEIYNLNSDLYIPYINGEYKYGNIDFNKYIDEEINRVLTNIENKNSKVFGSFICFKIKDLKYLELIYKNISDIFYKYSNKYNIDVSIIKQKMVGAFIYRNFELSFKIDLEKQVVKIAVIYKNKNPIVFNIEN